MIETLKNMKRSFVSSGANSYDPNVKSAACAEGADLYISKARDSLKSQNLMATSEHLQKAEDEFINNNDNHDVAVRQLCEIADIRLHSLKEFGNAMSILKKAYQKNNFESTENNEILEQSLSSLYVLSTEKAKEDHHDDEYIEKLNHVIVDTTLMISKLKEAKDQHRPPSPQ